MEVAQAPLTSTMTMGAAAQSVVPTSAPAADLRSVRGAMKSQREEFLRNLASRLESHLAEYIKSQPQTTFEEKSALVRCINRLLSELDLGIVCRKTGKVGVLGSSRDASHPSGRFLVRAKDGRSGMRVTETSARLPVLRLAPRQR